jgi:hypothetical protein
LANWDQGYGIRLVTPDDSKISSDVLIRFSEFKKDLDAKGTHVISSNKNPPGGWLAQPAGVGRRSQSATHPGLRLLALPGFLTWRSCPSSSHLHDQLP